MSKPAQSIRGVWTRRVPADRCAYETHFLTTMYGHLNGAKVFQKMEFSVVGSFTD